MPMSYLLFRVEDFRNRSRHVQGLNICPESKMFIKLVGCYLLRKAGFGEQGFDFQFCDNQNLGQSFEKCQI
jgi:hypothetical protein